MPIKIIEIKARCSDPAKIEKILKELNAEFKGTDRQTDTYFKCDNGRLKIREGNIENSLIFYNRADQAGPKRSDVNMMKLQPGNNLRSILSEAIGVTKVVSKKRKIFFIENVKFHIDYVEGLGNFVEIEAIDEIEKFTESELLEQCHRFLTKFEIPDKDLLKNSYSDLV